MVLLGGKRVVEVTRVLEGVSVMVDESGGVADEVVGSASLDVDVNVVDGGDVSLDEVVDGSSVVEVEVEVMGTGSVSLLGGACVLDEMVRVPVICDWGGDRVVVSAGSAGDISQKCQTFENFGSRYVRVVTLRSFPWRSIQPKHAAVAILNGDSSSQSLETKPTLWASM